MSFWKSAAVASALLCGVSGFGQTPPASPAPAAAPTYQQAHDALTRRDYPAALALFTALANTGNARAQSSLGAMYAIGIGVPQNSTEAVAWFRKSADQGFPEGISNLATSYVNGTGVPKDEAEAIKLYR